MEIQIPTTIDKNAVSIIPNVLTKEECSILNKWVLENYNTNIFQTGRSAKNRRTTRFTREVEYTYPELITNTFKKLREKLNLSNYESIPQGREGIICAISFNESKLANHVDPKYDDTESFHLVIKTSSGEEGGDLVIKDTVYKANAGDCLCFFASLHPHETTTLKCSTYRIVWINGVKIKV